MPGDRPKPEEGRRQLIREAGHGIRKPQGRARHPGKTKEGSLVQKIWAEMQKGKPAPESRRKEEVTPNLADNLMNLDCHGASALRFLIKAEDAKKEKAGKDEPSSASISISDMCQGRGK